ncbi:MAG TPA: L-rhamnose mutarotase [Novosphingobium sp.]|nr:L-rhamnose mutarotase [Novosphingobium sp.]HZV09174.1 L-rhamnose mutarotase [Novosphingobium sp.]
MERIAFRMRLKPGMLAEYRRRHDEIWPELAMALKAAGIHDYRIFHDADTDLLFATLLREEGHGMDALPDLPVMRRWWAAMAPLMEVAADDSPRSWPLTEVFLLP